MNVMLYPNTLLNEEIKEKHTNLCAHQKTKVR